MAGPGISVKIAIIKINYVLTTPRKQTDRQEEKKMAGQEKSRQADRRTRRWLVTAPIRQVDRRTRRWLDMRKADR